MGAFIMKKIIFTHGIDIDGYGCAVLAKLVWGENIDIVYADNFDLDDKFETVWDKTGGFAQYDEIFVTDHCFGMTECIKVEMNEEIRKRIKIFDHHSSRVGNQDRFSWVNIVPEKDGRKESGTSLFYQHLAERGLVDEKVDADSWIELTRLYDTWEWTRLGVSRANDLNTLSLAVGRENYIERLLKNHNPSERFEFTNEEKEIIQKYNENFQKQVKNYVNNIQVIEIDGVKAGYVEIMDVYKNDIASTVRELEIGKQISYMLMPVRDRGDSIT